jgi:NADPH:quinone reductase-like Zn-dependent oxidoreductase
MLTKAIVRDRYGSPDVLEVREVFNPVPNENEVLIAVRATSVNPLDRYFMRGRPYVMQPLLGFGKPRERRLGVDVAGVVEAVGSAVTAFQPGDEVFGAGRGAFAAYALGRESALAKKPGDVSFEQAAASNIAGTTALQGLRDQGAIRPGQRILINGASGGVGTFAVQIAKAFGAVVTAVCSSGKVEMVRSIGADEVVDYTVTDATQTGQRFDLFFDCAGNYPLSACCATLSPGGVYLAVGAPGGRFFAPIPRILHVALRGAVRRNAAVVTSRSKRADLVTLGELIQSGKLNPVMDIRRGLSEIPRAMRDLEEGRARGKIVVRVA